MSLGYHVSPSYWKIIKMLLHLHKEYKDTNILSIYTEAVISATAYMYILYATGFPEANVTRRTPGRNRCVLLRIKDTWWQKITLPKIRTRSPRTLALCLTPALGVTNGNFLQTCITNSLMYIN